LKIKFIIHDIDVLLLLLQFRDAPKIYFGVFAAQIYVFSFKMTAFSRFCIILLSNNKKLFNCNKEIELAK